MNNACWLAKWRSEEVKEWRCTLVTWRDVAALSSNNRGWRVSDRDTAPRPVRGRGGDGGAAELWIRLLCAWLRAGRRPRAEQRGAGVGGWARTGTESTLLRWRTYPTTSICRKLSGMLQRLTRTRIVCKFVQLYIWTEHQTGLYRLQTRCISYTVVFNWTHSTTAAKM